MPPTDNRFFKFHFIRLSACKKHGEQSCEIYCMPVYKTNKYSRIQEAAKRARASDLVMLAACINFDNFLRKVFVCADIIFRNLARETVALCPHIKDRLIRNGIPILPFALDIGDITCSL